MERAAPHVTGWPAEILGSGDRDMPDAAHGVSAWVATNAGADGFHWHAHGAGYTRAGLLHTVASRKRLEHRSGDEAGRVCGCPPGVDSTGLKIFGEGEWLAQKHKTRGIRRRWRKLHLGLDLHSGAIVCANLTHDDVGDSTALPGLLDQLDGPVTGFLADGAYDGASTRDLLRERYGETLDVVIPPPKNAVTRPQSARDPTVRDRHIAEIRSNGRMAWQVATGYNQRSRIETQIGRWKSVIGPRLRSRSFSRQITEIQVGQKVLNTMTALGRPVFERIA